MAARYPLPYAFARNQQLLLEQEGDTLTLWLHAATPPGGISETLRKYDAHQIELQVDNYDTVEEAGEFFYSPAFAKNPIGVDFNPVDLARRFYAGEDQAAIKKRPDSGARGLDTLSLR